MNDKELPKIEDFLVTTSDEIRYGDTGTALQSGTKVTKVNRSSITFEQGLFQNGICTARAETFIVQINEATRKSMPLGEAARAKLKSFM